MKTICFAMQKGGVGKSTMAASIAAELAAQTGRALLVDADPQGSASGWIGPKELNAELSDVLFGKAELKATITKTATPGLTLIPTAGLGGELNLYAKTLASQQDRCIKKVCNEAAALGYHFCVIDMSPAFGPLEWACYMAADEVITPILPDSFALDGLEIFSGNLVQFRKDKETAKPHYTRLIVNALDGRIPSHAEKLGKIKSYEHFKIFEFPVDPAFRKCQNAGLTVQSFTNTKPETRAELARLANDIIQEG
jgi:chromosome partitioning protein